MDTRRGGLLRLRFPTYRVWQHAELAGRRGGVCLAINLRGSPKQHDP